MATVIHGANTSFIHSTRNDAEPELPVEPSVNEVPVEVEVEIPEAEAKEPDLEKKTGWKNKRERRKSTLPYGLKEVPDVKEAPEEADADTTS